MTGDVALDAFCAKKRGLSYGQFVALTDERERERIWKQYKKEFEKMRREARKGKNHD